MVLVLLSASVSTPSPSVSDTHGLPWSPSRLSRRGKSPFGYGLFLQPKGSRGRHYLDSDWGRGYRRDYEGRSGRRTVLQTHPGTSPVPDEIYKGTSRPHTDRQ